MQTRRARADTGDLASVVDGKCRAEATIQAAEVPHSVQLVPEERVDGAARRRGTTHDLTGTVDRLGDAEGPSEGPEVPEAGNGIPPHGTRVSGHIGLAGDLPAVVDRMRDALEAAWQRAQIT